MAKVLVDEEVLQGLLSLAEWHFKDTEDKEINALFTQAHKVLHAKADERERVRKSAEKRRRNIVKKPKVSMKDRNKEVIRKYLEPDRERKVMVKELCVLTGNNPNTVKKYLDELEREGLIDRSKTNSRSSVFDGKGKKA